MAEDRLSHLTKDEILDNLERSPEGRVLREQINELFMRTAVVMQVAAGLTGKAALIADLTLRHPVRASDEIVRVWVEAVFRWRRRQIGAAERRNEALPKLFNVKTIIPPVRHKLVWHRHVVHDRPCRAAAVAAEMGHLQTRAPQ